jgi:hypothetical protein
MTSLFFFASTAAFANDLVDTAPVADLAAEPAVAEAEPEPAPPAGETFSARHMGKTPADGSVRHGVRVGYVYMNQ